MKLLKKGSVKDIFEGHEVDELIFKFSNRYSIYDWGEMPDEIPSKGTSLAIMSVALFDYLSEDIRNHFISSIDSHNKKCSIFDIHDSICIRKFNVPLINFNNGFYDYSYYQKSPEYCTLPLEVIFRFGAPKGSSIYERLEDTKYIQSIGLNRIINENELFDDPIIEFSSKLETTDRYMSYEEAQKISNLNDQEWNELFNKVIILSKKLKNLFDDIGLVLWDGKFEFALGERVNNERELILIDSVGPDELRITGDKTQLSKQILRNYYKSSDWYTNILKSKEITKSRNSNDWKNICLNELHSLPQKAPEELIFRVSHIYKSLANEITKRVYGKGLLNDSLSIDSLLELLA